MLTAELFQELVTAASRAPSADNMQGWAFRRNGDNIEVFLEQSRMLPTDVNNMFGWVGIGAAVENIVVTAAHLGFSAQVTCGESADNGQQEPTVVSLSPGGDDDPLASVVQERVTNRFPYESTPLSEATTAELGASARDLDAGIHWVSSKDGCDRMAKMDANSTYIRLEYKPLHDELFEILRFSQKEMESKRFGLDFESLGVPAAMTFFGSQLRHWSVNKLVSRLGMGRVMARMLASRLRQAGALCLVTARRSGAAGYIEAGRAMERVWLAAVANGLAVQPHGVLPQYLTKVEIEPETFAPKYVAALRGLQPLFADLFPGAQNEHPAILLRVGKAQGQPPRKSLRLFLEDIVRES